MAVRPKPPTKDLSLIICLWAPVSGQHMLLDVLLSVVKNRIWQEETEASSVPTSPDAPTAPVARMEGSIIPGVIYFG